MSVTKSVALRIIVFVLNVTLLESLTTIPSDTGSLTQLPEAAGTSFQGTSTEVTLILKLFSPINALSELETRIALAYLPAVPLLLPE